MSNAAQQQRQQQQRNHLQLHAVKHAGGKVDHDGGVLSLHSASTVESEYHTKLQFQTPMENGVRM
jgi:hypothetical protein